MAVTCPQLSMVLASCAFTRTDKDRPKVIDEVVVDYSRPAIFLFCPHLLGGFSPHVYRLSPTNGKADECLFVFYRTRSLRDALTHRDWAKTYRIWEEGKRSCSYTNANKMAARELPSLRSMCLEGLVYWQIGRYMNFPVACLRQSELPPFITTLRERELLRTECFLA